MQKILQSQHYNRGMQERITIEDIEAEVAHECYFTAAEGSGESLVPLQRLTFCVLTLRNGFTVTGEASPPPGAAFSREVGRRSARDKAISKIWMLNVFRRYEKNAAGKD